MSSLRQIEANRLNAQKSTGPRSVTGKAASSMNALKSGIDARSQIIRGEKAADLEALTAQYLDEYQPATPTERCCVDILIRSDWLLRRLAHVEAEIWEFLMEEFYDLEKDTPLGQTFSKRPRPFETLQRRISATERSYKLALHELRLLQAARPPAPVAPPVSENKTTSPAIGFVPSTSPNPGPVPPSTPPAPPPAATFRTFPPGTSSPKYGKLVVF